MKGTNWIQNTKETSLGHGRLRAEGWKSSLGEKASAVGGADGKISLLDAQHLVEQWWGLKALAE